MADVFISYKREEREHARRIAQALSHHGFSVWWDAEILPGEQYRAVTLQILQSCRAAIVVWSPLSVGSGWVLDEAQRALDRGVLVPVMCERIPQYPLGFGQLHAHNLLDWDGDPNHASFAPVVAAVRRLVGAPDETPQPAQRAAADVETEVAFWRGVQDSRKAADFESYLARYGDGLFADLARQRIAELAAAPKRARTRKAPAAEPPPQQAAATLRAAAAMPRAAPQAQSAHASFSRAELAFVAAVVFLAGFLAWPVANLALGLEPRLYKDDWTSLLDLRSLQNLYLMTPLLTAAAWGYDRAVGWWTAQGRAPSLLYWGTFGVLALAFVVSLNMRARAGGETHFVLWLAAAIGAALIARRGAAWVARQASAIGRQIAERRPSTDE